MTKKDFKIEQTIAFKGIIGEIVHEKQPDGRTFEYYRRSPGVRVVLISQENKILLTRELRRETGGVDLRLPGGKVRDTIEQYRELLESDTSLEEAARQTAITEVLEETGYEIQNPSLLMIANNGTTVEWDLYYFVARDYSENLARQQLGVGENIETVWMSADQIRTAIRNGEMHEWRTVGVILGLILPEL
jgi:ADP-ribose pyrophosphatase YjhB (NUDIX family)